MKLLPIPALLDNYIWMMHNGVDAVVVDPGDSAVVIAALGEQALRLQAILVTHHHADHVGGVSGLLPFLHGPVYAPQEAKLDACGPQLHRLSGGESLELLGCRVQTWLTPGHTLGHLSHVVYPAQQSPILFCGDTLFSAGCGRLFEGSAEQMGASLRLIATLPPETRVCCTHEYTLANLRFAAAAEPQNPDIPAHQRLCLSLRAEGRPTLPSTLGLESRINPFLRACTQQPQALPPELRCASADGLERFAALRLWKDRFS
jgi:hydroxyacylglutathione hydrolase